MHTPVKILTALSVAGLTFAGGSAFTASNTQPAAATVGYGSTTVSGATVDSLKYNLDPTGANITSVDLVLAGDTTASAVSMNFNSGTSFSCGTGVTSGTSPSVLTTYTCTNPAQTTSTLESTAVIVN